MNQIKKIILTLGLMLSVNLWAEENKKSFLEEYLNSSPAVYPSKIYVLDANKEVAVVVLCINDTVVVMSESGGLVQLMDRGSRTSGHFGLETPMKCKDYK
jgi:hypothetical protein